MTEYSLNSRKRILINSATNVTTHLFRLFIAIFMTPFLLHRLGAEVYAIIPLINSCVAYLILASGGIQSSIGRFATLNIAKGEFEEANKYINTGIPSILTIPAEHEFEAQIVMFLLGSNLILGLLLSPFTTGNYVRQRFDLTNYIQIAAQLLQTLIIIFSFIYVDANIIFIASATLFTEI